MNDTAEATFETFLDRIGLRDRMEQLEAEGISSLHDLSLLDTSDMKELGFTIGQRNRLKRSIGLATTSLPASQQQRNDDVDITPEESNDGHQVKYLLRQVDSYLSGLNEHQIDVAKAQQLLQESNIRHPCVLAYEAALLYPGRDGFMSTLLKKDKNKAIVKFDQAVSLGLDDGSRYGFFFRGWYSFVVLEDAAAALPHFLRAAKLGHSDAMLLVAGICLVDEGEERNIRIEESYRYAKMAADMGSADGQCLLSQFYRHGIFVDENIKEAIDLLNKANLQGHDESCYWLGEMHKNGIGFQKSDEQAVFYYEMAIERGSSLGHLALGIMHEEGRGVPQNFQLAAFHYKIAAKHFDGDAEYRLGMLLIRGNGISRNYHEAVHHLKAAVAQRGGCADAEFALGVLYKNGQGVSQSDEEAARRYGNAAEKGHAEAAFNLELMNESVHTFLGIGSGIEMTPSEKEEYLQIFAAVDTDGNGEMDFDEFLHSLKQLEVFESEAKSRRLFDQADEDFSGTVDREEFMKLMHLAKTGNKFQELTRIAKAGQRSIEKLQNSNWFMTLEDAMVAPVTHQATDQIERLKTMYGWVPSTNSCNEANCNFVFNLLILDTDLIENLMGHVCTELLEEIEKTLLARRIHGFMKNVNVQAVVDDGTATFFNLMHRFAHTNTIDFSDVPFLHSLRKAGIIEAANDSVQEVREFAEKIMKVDDKGELDQDPRKPETSSHGDLKSVFVQTAGRAAGRAIISEVVLPASAMEAGCTVM